MRDSSSFSIRLIQGMQEEWMEERQDASCERKTDVLPERGVDQYVTLFHDDERRERRIIQKGNA